MGSWFQFSDVLLYANRTSSSSLQFKVHGQVPLRGIEVENYEPRHSAPHCFAIYSQSKPLIVAARLSGIEFFWKTVAELKLNFWGANLSGSAFQWWWSVENCFKTIDDCLWHTVVWVFSGFHHTWEHSDRDHRSDRFVLLQTSLTACLLVFVLTVGHKWEFLGQTSQTLLGTNALRTISSRGCLQGMWES